MHCACARPGGHQLAAQRHELCGEEGYLALQQQFRILIVAYATEAPAEAGAAAASGAQQWLGVVEEAGSRAEGAALRKLKAQMVLLAYYGLFDVHRQSAGLADVCPRCTSLFLPSSHACRSDLVMMVAGWPAHLTVPAHHVWCGCLGT